MTTAELSIERLAFGGKGVGRINGKVCFVPFSAPGDHLKVRLIREYRSYCEAELLEILKASPDRVQPCCPAFGQCGGCDWQHISYTAQCRAKQSIVSETLQRVARLESPKVADTVISELPYGYRARAQFKISKTPTGLAAGFFRRGSHHVIDLPQGCPVVTPAINSAMAEIRLVLLRVPDAHRIFQVSLEEGQAGVVAIIHHTDLDQQHLQRLLLKKQSQLGLAGLFLQSGRRGEELLPVFGHGHLTYAIPLCGSADSAIELGYEIGSFSQVNRRQNQNMARLVCNYARPDAGQRLLDLYCGNGNLSLPMSGSVAELLGIEGFAPSIASAVDNARQLRVNNSTFRCNDAARELKQLLQQREQFDLVLLDPPRSGAAGVVGELSALGPKKIVYVSCDPTTLARDISILCNVDGFRLNEATPLDMFPQTAHLETVALLSKK